MEQQPLKYHTSVETLPLNKFIDVVVDGNMAALIISGMPETWQLLEAWAKIHDEYTDMVADGEDRVHVKLYKEIVLLKVDILQVKMIIECMERVYHKELADRLNRLLHTAIVFNPQEPEEYMKLLKGAGNRAKAFKIDLDLKELQMKDIEAKRAADSKSGKKTYSRQYFQSILITISDHAKYEIGDGITTYQFVERIKRYNDHARQIEELNNKTNAGRRTNI